MKQEYYSPEKIMAEGSTYNIIIGQRGNGKTYSIIDEALDEFLKNGTPSVYLRRYDESLTSTNIFKLCTPHIDDLIIMSNGEWNNFEFKSKTFYLSQIDENGKKLKVSKPFLYYIHK